MDKHPTQKAIKTQKQSVEKAKETNNKEDWDRYKEIKKETRKANRLAYQTHVRSFIEEDIPKNLWKLIKSKKSDATGVAPLKKDGLTHSQSSDKTNILNDQFCSVFTTEDMKNIPNLDVTPHQDMPEIEINTKGVEKLLRNLNPKKAAGPDMIPCRLLQTVAEQLAPALTTLFRTSLETGQVPQDWKHALVQPVYKKGDRSTAANYRPISLTSVCCKVMEHIVRTGITNHLENCGILSDHQHGFRKKRSCETQLILTLNDLAEEINQNGQTDTILLDFAKAFDKVPHHRLRMKLHHYGIRGKTLDWVANFLANRTQQVGVEGEKSTIGHVTSGVPQGSVLGPTLFLAYINDLGNNIKAKVRLFADDTILYRNIKHQQDADELQTDLKTLETWEKKWQMEFNVTKCNVLSMTNKRKKIPPKYTLHGHILEQVPSAKYLGVEIHEKLHWGNHIHSITARANRTSAFVYRNLKGCPPEIQTHCYKGLVRPVLEYASPVWDPYQKDLKKCLELVQRRAARRILHDFSPKSSATALVRKLGLQTLKDRRQIDKAALIYKIFHGLVDVPSNKVLKPTTRSTRGQQTKFQVPHSNVNAHLHSFFPSAIWLWNILPQEAVMASSLPVLKTTIGKWIYSN
ncbi:hypothetical protein ACOMHN_021015 [Nucella lapillus]